jgi:hypothetical protein
MAMKVTGGCHCGNITYEPDVDPATVMVCHCTDCQKLTGRAFRTNISSLPGTFRLKTGTPTIYVKTTESRNKRAHGFCPECGTPIYATSPHPDPTTYGYGLVVSTNERYSLHRPVTSGAARRNLGDGLKGGGESRARVMTD